MFFDDNQNENKDKQEIRRLQEEVKRFKSHACLLAISTIVGLIICVLTAISNGAHNQKFFFCSFGDATFSLGILWFWINIFYLFVGAPSTKELHSKLICIYAAIIVLLSIVTMIVFYKVMLPY